MHELKPGTLIVNNSTTRLYMIIVVQSYDLHTNVGRWLCLWKDDKESVKCSSIYFRLPLGPVCEIIQTLEESI